MAEARRISALHGQVAPGRIGGGGAGATTDAPGVVLSEVGGLALRQIAAWPHSVDAVGQIAATAAGVAAAPGPCRTAVSTATGRALLRIEPLKWWLLGAPNEPLAINPEQGATLDLSHSRARLRIAGPRAAELLNRHLPLDLREAAFPEGAVASSALHHVGVTVWRWRGDYDLFIPRGYALSLWEVLLQSAAQFGAEVAPGANV